MATGIAFEPTGDGRAAITGDFVMSADEVNPVLRTLRANGSAQPHAGRAAAAVLHAFLGARRCGEARQGGARSARQDGGRRRDLIEASLKLQPQRFSHWESGHGLMSRWRPCRTGAGPEWFGQTGGDDATTGLAGRPASLIFGLQSRRARLTSGRDGVPP